MTELLAELLAESGDTVDPEGSVINTRHRLVKNCNISRGKNVPLLGTGVLGIM